LYLGAYLYEIMDLTRPLCAGCGLEIPHRSLKLEISNVTYDFHGIQCFVRLCNMNGVSLDYEYDRFTIKNMKIDPPKELLGRPLKTALG